MTLHWPQDFVEKRKIELGEFLRELIDIPQVFNSRHFARFLGIEEDLIMELYKGLAPPSSHPHARLSDSTLRSPSPTLCALLRPGCNLKRGRARAGLVSTPPWVPRSALRLHRSTACIHQPLDMQDFELLRVVGKGTFGKVMQVRKKDSGEIYAMKVLSKQTVLAKKQVRASHTTHKHTETCANQTLGARVWTLKQCLGPHRSKTLKRSARFWSSSTIPLS